MFSIVFWCYLLLFFIIFNVICSFNLSPKFSVVINDPSRQEGSFFGFAVHLRSGIDRYASSIVVGAPKANSSFTAHRQISEPGVVYQCNIDEFMETIPICYPLLLDPTGEVKDNSPDYVFKHRKTHAWLGASLDGQSSRGGRLVACAPRWTNQYYLQTSKTLLNNGLCYWVPDTTDANRTAEKLIPLLNRNLQNFKGKVRDYYGYAFGEAGFSVHMPNTDGSQVLLGAPGVISWKGSVVWYKDAHSSNQMPVYKRYASTLEAYGDILVPNTYYNKRIKFESYFGYSLNSGIFLSIQPQKKYFVASAPRDNNYKGKVFLFDLRDDEVFRKQEILITKELEGQQMGEYFGASLCVVDVNGDGLDDVIIGAPRHSLESNFNDVGDEGGVYVFLNADYWKFNEQSKLKFAQEIGSQFGTSISSLGDLDQDGYNDIAVGAPYEDDGKGAIYIYLGSSKGLKPIASQYIKAKTIDNSLLSFGYSLSKGVDIDSNAYNDLVVGAYRSEMVVLFRSQPVARLTGRIIPLVQEIKIDTTEFDVKFCILYDGNNVPNFINVTLNIHADSIYKRGSFLLEDGSYKAVIKKIISVNYKIEHCRTLTMRIRAQNQDFSKPIEVSMQYFLDKNKLEANQSFCATCPVLDPYSDNFSETRIPYLTGCGHDNKCAPDLKLTAEFFNDIFIIGSSKSIKFNVTVDNLGEPAFFTRLYLNMPNDLNLVEIPTNCNKIKNGLLRCELGNLLLKSDQKNMTLELETLNIKSGSEFINVNMSVTSMGEEQNQLDNVENLTLSLLTISQLTINGKSIPEQLQYKDEENELKNNEMTIFQEYEIRNFGPSPITASLVQFFIPVIYDNIVLFKVSEPETSLGKQSIVCNATDPGFNLVNDELGDSSPLFEIQERKRRSSATNSIISPQIASKKIQKRDISFIPKNTFPANRTLFLNCSDRNPLVFCMTITCSIGLLKDSKTDAKIKLSFQAQLEKIEQVLGEKDITQLDVDAVVTALVKVDTDSGGKTSITLGSTLIGSLHSVPIPTLWIALAIALALLIMVFIITALMKSGFFKRNKKEELELLKEQSAFQEFEEDQD